ncbi:MAG: fused MFS/spermidine synthase [Blastochloris sp.]|nr:fused MFS/spermidine synthase [Blastochloris sp.]
MLRVDEEADMRGALVCLVVLWMLGTGRMWGAWPELGEEPLHFESMYQPLILRKEKDVVVMKTERKGKGWNYSAVYLKDPREIVLAYTKHFFLLPVFKENPERVLLIGLGGGGINALIQAAYPEAVMESVEIDPKVLELAERYMGFKAGPKNQVQVMDGRMALKRSKQRYDWVILDAFRGGDVPVHLKTREFYGEIQAKLSPRGVVASNLIRGNELFAADVATLRASFKQVLFFKVEETGNVVAIAANHEEPRLEELLAKASLDTVNPTVLSYVRVLELAQRRYEPEEKGGMVMTDDFAPAEYLDGKSSK